MCNRKSNVFTADVNTDKLVANGKDDYHTENSSTKKTKRMQQKPEDTEIAAPADMEQLRDQLISFKHYSAFGKVLMWLKNGSNNFLIFTFRAAFAGTIEALVLLLSLQGLCALWNKLNFLSFLNIWRRVAHENQAHLCVYNSSGELSKGNE